MRYLVLLRETDELYESTESLEEAYFIRNIELYKDSGIEAVITDKNMNIIE